jgi:hypothetical protein
MLIFYIYGLLDISCFIEYTFLKLYVPYSVFHVRWVPCHHSMARPQVEDGGDGLQIY